MENIVFDKEELYFVIQIENKSTLDYDLNFLNLSIETRQKGKKKSLQRLYQEPIYKHNLPSKIAENKTIRFVYVLPKFSLSNDRRAILELNEKEEDYVNLINGKAISSQPDHSICSFFFMLYNLLLSFIC